MREHLREWPLWLLATTAAAFFFRPLSFETFFFRDIHQILYPARVFLTETFREGTIPLWNPLLHAGMPFLADPVNLALYPPNLLLTVVSPVTGMNLLIVLHYPVAAIGGYLLARQLRVTESGAFLVGLVFALSGFTLSLANHTQTLASFVYLPWLLLGLFRAMDRRPGGMLLGVVAETMTVLAGSPEVILASVGVSFVLIVVVAPPEERRRVFGVWFLVMAMACGLSLIRTIPTIEMMMHSRRSAAGSVSELTQWSFHPSRLPELVVSEFFGPLGRLSSNAYWGEARVDRSYPYILQVFLGFGAVCLAVIGVGAGKRGTRRLRWALAGLAAAGILLSLGRFLPGYEMIQIIPIVNRLRYPEKFFMLSVLPVSLLAGFGLERVREETSRVWIASVSLASFVALSFGLVIFSGSGGAFLEYWFASPIDLPLQKVLGSRILETGLVAGAIAVLFLLHGRGKLSRISFLLVMVVTAEILWAGRRVNQYAPRQFFDAPSSLAVVEKVVGDGRLWAAETPDHAVIVATTDEVFWQQLWKVDVLSGYSAVRYGVPVVFTSDFDGLAPSRMAALAEMVRQLPWPQRRRFLELAGVRAVISTERLDETFDPVGRLRNRSNVDFYLYRMNGRRARFVSKGRNIEDESEAVRLILAGKLDPDQEVLLEGVDPGVSEPCDDMSVTPRSTGPNSVVYDTTSSCAGFLLLAQTHYPGWEFRVDGEPVDFAKANFAFVALRVPAGVHRVEGLYRPIGFMAGVWGSVITLLMISLAVLSRRGSSRPTSEPESR